MSFNLFLKVEIEQVLKESGTSLYSFDARYEKLALNFSVLCLKISILCEFLVLTLCILFLHKIFSYKYVGNLVSKILCISTVSKYLNLYSIFNQPILHKNGVMCSLLAMLSEYLTQLFCIFCSFCKSIFVKYDPYILLNNNQ